MKSAITTAILFGACLGVAAAATPIDESRALAPDAKVEIDNLKGRIEVRTWNEPRIQIRGTLGKGTEGLEVEGTESSLRVRVKYPESSGWFGGWGSGSAQSSELLVTLPPGVSLGVDSVSAEIDIDGVAGRTLSIDSVSGDLVVRSDAADINIDSVSGDLRMQSRSPEVNIDNVSGEIELLGNYGGRIRIDSVSGSVRIDSDGAARTLQVGVVSGDISVRTALQPGARLEAESLSGDLEVAVPANTSARVTASSFTGSIRSSHGTVQTSEHGPGSSLDTTLGGGDARIELETFSGDLRLRTD